MLFVNKDLPQRTLPDFVAYAKAHPGEYTYATISLGSQTQLVNEMLQNEAGIQMTYVPYRGANLIVNDVLGGHLTLGSLALSAAAGQLKAGALRGLAIGTEERLPAFAGNPGPSGLGYPDLVSSTWFGLSGPANLPPPIVARLNTEVVKALHAPDVLARLESEAIDTKSLNAADFTAFFKQEVVRWTIAKAVAAKAKDAGQASAAVGAGSARLAEISAGEDQPARRGSARPVGGQENPHRDLHHMFVRSLRSAAPKLNRIGL